MADIIDFVRSMSPDTDRRPILIERLEEDFSYLAEDVAPGSDMETLLRLAFRAGVESFATSVGVPISDRLGDWLSGRSDDGGGA